MKTKSCYSTDLDPYKAGIEIAEKLAEIHPEVIILFSTVHYKGSSELTEAIYDELAVENLKIIGNTGDGFYEADLVEDIGVSALGINSEGAIKWQIAYQKGIAKDPYDAAASCVKELQKMSSTKESKFCFLATDFRTDGARIIEGVVDHIDMPVIGGLAADDYSMEESYVYVNREVYTDTIALLSASGNFKFDISIAHNLKEVGKTGKVTESEGTKVLSIDGIPAMDFIEREIGKPIGTVDEGIITFKLTEGSNKEDFQVRSLLLSGHRRDKGVQLFGSVAKGNKTKTCLAHPSKIISDVLEISKGISKLPFTPKAAIIVSCAGRKRVLQSKITDEVKSIRTHNPDLSAIIGYPSFGEIGPVKRGNKYSKTYFHNMSFIILTIGD